MSKEQDVSTPAAEEVKETAPEAVEEAKEETIAEAMPQEEEHKVPDSIPYDRFKEKVDENNDLKKQLEELQNSDKTDAEVASDLESIAEEHNVDTKVLEKLAKTLEAQTTRTIEERLAPLTEKEQREKQDKVLSQMLDRALEANPEFKDSVNKDFIKQVALLPGNRDKTFSQLLQDAYPSATQSPEKKTMETVAPGKSEAIDKVDYDRAQQDPDYFKKVMADPSAKKAYNEQMLEKLGSVI